MKKAHWAWEYTGPKGTFSGYVQAAHPRDAAAQAIASTTATGKTFGEDHGIPGDFVDGISTNDSSFLYAKHGPDFMLSVKKITCPTDRRYAADIVGCGSDHLSGPDEEGIFDCCDCGMFFDPASQAMGGQA